MKLARNLFFLFTVTIFASASVILNTFNYNPYQSDNTVFVNFFASLFFATAGISTFIIYALKMKFYKDKNINKTFIPSIRQGILISIGISILLILRTLQILDWWVAGPMVIAVILLELFFQTSSPMKKRQQDN